MRAIEISTFGPPEVLRLCERPIPEVSVGELLIKVHAAGINRPDIFQRQGYYPPPAGSSDLPGLEIAGEVIAGDLGHTRLTKGDHVCALVSGGGYAEYCVAPAAQCLPIPIGWTLEEAASLPETFFTVWSNIFEKKHFLDQVSLLVHGGSSGIGTTAIQMGSALGHRVFTTAGSVEKCQACEALGAVRAINYLQENFVTVIHEMTKGRGVDVILDMVAGEYVSRNLDCLAEEGLLVLIATLGGKKATVDCQKLMAKRLTITGSTLRARPVTFKAAIARSLYARIWPLLEAKRIKPTVFKAFPLAQASQAHRLMETGQHIGKIILTV